MAATIRSATGAIFCRRYLWTRSAWVIWTAVVVIMVLRPLVASYRGTSFDTYHLAGVHWIHGERVYSQWMGFVYSPVVAVFFALNGVVAWPQALVMMAGVPVGALLGSRIARVLPNEAARWLLVAIGAVLTVAFAWRYWL